jgi:DMSO/TMAO reductase YedYZ molybdopterin-dependent catalytic subunit
MTTWVATRPPLDGVPWPLRRVLEMNEQVGRAVFSGNRLAPEFPAARAGEPRVNGRVGLRSTVETGDWTVHVSGRTDQQIPISVLRELPAHELTVELKCVEGWSRIVRWKGVRLADFLGKFGAACNYVSISTPLDGKDAAGRADRYFVGLDWPSAVHQQTLLCYDMNGQPLSEAHGAPLRLISSVKYGYKCIKRVSHIELTNERPPDYWALRGYDWYAGH